MANKGNIRKWVAALRSGEYEQGTGFLNKNGKWCCLGVACDLAVKDGVDVAVAVGGPGDRQEGATTYNGHHGYMPGTVDDWLGGIGQEAGFGSDELDIIIGTDSEGYELAASSANDDAGWDFNQIADAIEKKYLAEELVAA